MLIEEKYFYQDKNHLLKTVQAFSKEALISNWLQTIFHCYNQQHNPLNLEDDFIIQLRKNIKKGSTLLSENYDLLSAIYRFKYSDNQLEFQWDGRSHMEKYDEEWREAFDSWSKKLSVIKNVQRLIIKSSVQGEGVNNHFLKLSIRRSILGFFNIRFRSNTLSAISA